MNKKSCELFNNHRMQPFGGILSLIQGWCHQTAQKRSMKEPLTPVPSKAKPNAAIHKRYYLGSKFPGLYLSWQEARCVFYFIQGLTHIQTSQVMHISHRTISSYTHNMKLKLCCRNKDELVRLIMDSDFMRYYQELALLEQ